MSRVGKKVIVIPAGVTLSVEGKHVRCKGPKGELELDLHMHTTLVVDGDRASVAITDEQDKKQRALWGLTRKLVANLVEGVTKGFEKKLEFNGVGFKVSLQGNKLVLDVGYSHQVEYTLFPGIAAAVEKNIITITGIDKYRVGETAAQIRKIRKPEPYGGTGIKYVDEVILRKAGKTAKSA